MIMDDFTRGWLGCLGTLRESQADQGKAFDLNAELDLLEQAAFASLAARAASEAEGEEKPNGKSKFILYSGNIAGLRH